MIDPLGVISLLVGTGGVGTAILAFRRSKPEAKKLDADTAAVIATTAGKWVLDADDRMAEMQATLTRLVHNQRAHEELLTVHARWDRQMLDALRDAGVEHLPSPPPIYLPQTG
jgi:NADH/NAD ratio-sensing transcriptional regulator Rex